MARGAALRIVVAAVAVAVTAMPQECEEVKMLQARREIIISGVPQTSKNSTPETADDKETKELANKYDKLKPLKAVARLLAKAMFYCQYETRDQCLPTLKEYRQKIWPKIEGELGKNLTNIAEPIGLKNISDWGDWHPFYLQTDLTGCRAKVTYVHVPQSPGKSFVPTLKKYDTLGSMRRTPKNGNNECNMIDRHGTNAMVFVRNPLTRFMEAYEEHLKLVKPEIVGMSLLEEKKETSKLRARRFVESFLQGKGENMTGSLIPQTEYFVPVNRNCTVNIRTVLKEEHKEKAWNKLLERKGCGAHASEMPFLLEEEKGPKQFAFLQSSSFAVTGMDEALFGDDAAHLRAFCWFSLPDYFILNYDLPEKCMETDMSMIVDWAWTWKITSIEEAERTASFESDV